MGKKDLDNNNARLSGAQLAGMANERHRCMEIALGIWKKKPAKDAEWYKTVGEEIVEEIKENGPFGIPIEEEEDNSREFIQGLYRAIDFRDRKIDALREKLKESNNEIFSRVINEYIEVHQLVFSSHSLEAANYRSLLEDIKAWLD